MQTVLIHSGVWWKSSDISNMFDEMNHLAILDAVRWALNNVAKWTSNKTRQVDRLSVAKYGKAVQLGCDYTERNMIMITASQVMQVCMFHLAHSKFICE